MFNPLLTLPAARQRKPAAGIYACCSASPIVLQAAMEKAKATHTPLLIESTANQVNQYGGYTGMQPAVFRAFVLAQARAAGLDEGQLFLGGDHLGPLTFAHLDSAQAMDKAEALVRAYARAGYTKIHLDTSMRLGDDPANVRLPDTLIAQRAARLAKACEEEVQILKEAGQDVMEPVYIIGSEVPIPGGALHEQAGMQITRPEDLHASIQAFSSAFAALDLQDAWKRVIGVVVQPGVEEKDSGCTDYERAKAADLVQALQPYENLVFEGHSTDYQTPENLRQLVEDGFGILKVGPALTCAAREALFALAMMEKELLPAGHSHFMEILDAAMVKDPRHWQSHYHGSPHQQALRRKYSFSDRSRYYMSQPAVTKAMETMMANLSKTGIPLFLLSQYMPIQYAKVRAGLLLNQPEALVKDRIQNTIDDYLFATRQDCLFEG